MGLANGTLLDALPILEPATQWTPVNDVSTLLLDDQEPVFGETTRIPAPSRTLGRWAGAGVGVGAGAPSGVVTVTSVQGPPRPLLDPRSPRTIRRLPAVGHGSAGRLTSRASEFGHGVVVRQLTSGQPRYGGRFNEGG